MPRQDNCTERYYRWGPPISKKRYDCTSFLPRTNKGSGTALAEAGSVRSYETHYKTACHVTNQAVKQENLQQLVSRERVEALREEFSRLASVWRRETSHLSIVSKKLMHPAYFEIVGLGTDVIPLILEALRDRPAYWFTALKALSRGENPAPPDAPPSVARDAWLAWGRARGYIDNTMAAGG